MATAGSSPLPPSSAPVAEASQNLVSRLVETTTRIATSWFGLAVGYFAALSGTVFAYQKLEEPLKGMPRWLRPALVLLPLLFVFFVHTLPTLVDSYRRRRLGEIKGELKPGYFRLCPREDVEGF